jgi:hypothetical protein
MKPEDIIEFRGSSDEFRHRSHRRMLGELLVLLSAALLYFFKWPANLPRWMVLGTIVLAAGGLIIDAFYYRRGKALADSLVIKDLPDSLLFSDLNGTRTLPYRDMAILTTQTRNGEIIEIILQVFPGISIKLRGLHDMNEFYGRLVQHLQC